MVQSQSQSKMEEERMHHAISQGTSGLAMTCSDRSDWLEQAQFSEN